MPLSFSSVDFPEKYQNWATIDPQDLFDAPILKKESNPKVIFSLFFVHGGRLELFFWRLPMGIGCCSLHFLATLVYFKRDELYCFMNKRHA